MKLFKKSLAVFLSAIMVCSFAAFPMSAGAAVPAFTTLADKGEKTEYKEGEVIIVLKASADKGYLKAANASSRYGKNIKLKSTYSFSGKNKKNKLNVAVLKSNKYTAAQLVKKLSKNPAVKYAFPNTKKRALDITNDTYSKYQWALENNGQNGGTANSDVNAEGLWEKASASEKEQIVAIVDTGLDLTHPEFKDMNNVWTNTHGSRLLGEHGYDFVNNDGDPQDDNGHGTHCAGIVAAAADNEAGISGINKSNTKIMPVKWLDEDGSGFTEDVLASYDYINRALDLGENVIAISNSWGGEGPQEEIDAFTEIFDKFGERGVVSLVAAGNEATDITEGRTEMDSIFGKIELDEPVFTTPASCDSPYQLTVGATNEKDELAAFSNYSKTKVDVAAPGTDILSTVCYDCFNPSIYTDEKKAALVEQYQNYDSTFSSGDLGYPTPVAISHEDSKEFFNVDFSTNVTVTQTDKHFGTEGKSLTITTQDEIETSEDEEDVNALLYCLEIPYSVADESKSYSVSFMTSSNTESFMLAADVPADYEIKDNFEDLIYSYTVGQFGGGNGGTYWDHVFYNVNPKDKVLLKGKDRKIVLLAESYEKGTEYTFDDFAISYQDVDTANFEKYDFYCGTSMATPYVAGAVALVKNAYPDATARDVVNMVKNTGRYVEGLKEQIETGRVISLENPEKIPPMIFNAGYNEKGQITIDGSFRDVTTVKVNGTEVTPASSGNNEIVVADKNYSTNKITVEVENAIGKDEYTGLVSNKKLIELSKEVEGEPFGITDGSFVLPAGDKAYFIYGYSIGSISYDKDMAVYNYEESLMPIDATKLFESKDEFEALDCYVSAATYSNGYIFFAVIKSITASNGMIIGYDNAFGCYDIETGETVKLCELPEDAMFGSSLAAYNGTIYLLGGYDNLAYSSNVYTFDTTKKEFVKSSASLPEGRAYTKFIQYENKLYGVYGAVESGKLPAVISFDGKSWSSSKLSLESDDFTDYTTDPSVPVVVYSGNLGYGKNGLFLNGVYVYGYGDTYTYDVKNDKLVASEYAAKNTLDGTKLVGTTLPGCFIGYEAEASETDIDDEDDLWSMNKKIITGDSYDDYDDDLDDFDFEITPTAYKLDIETSYAKVVSSVKNAKVKPSKVNAVYGDNVTITVTPNKGYVVESVSVNGKVFSKTNKATVKADTATIKVTASVKNVTPAKVKGLKATAKNGRVTLKWKKAARAKGYQVQQYKGGKWKTVKTIKKAKTTKATVKAKKGTKFRVRAFNKYSGKTYNGKWSKAVKAK